MRANPRPAGVATGAARRLALAAGLCLGLALGACGDGGGSDTRLPLSDEGADVAFEPPAFLLDARAVDRDALQLELLVDGDRVDVVRNEAGLFTATLQLPPNVAFAYALTWSELFEGRILPLARFEGTYTPSADGRNEVRVFAAQYDSSRFDADGDGRSNLFERQDSPPTSPFLEDAAPIVNVPLAVEFTLPGPLAEADEDLRVSFDARAIVTIGEGQQVLLPLSRDGDVWRGEALVARGSMPFVDVEFFTDSDPGLVLAELQSSVAADGDAPSVSFAADDELYRFPNGDGDSLSNVEELIEGDGRDPRRSDDPAPDPCESSQFALGCEIDTDGDGRFDFQEGPEADRDGDGRPDYTESSLIDEDDDGRAEDNDVDDGNACIPSEDNDACRSVLDDDGDGVANPVDNCPADPNPEQENIDGDSLGDACDTQDDRDGDGDGVRDEIDNCPTEPNADQANVDGDEDGNACDTRDDRDEDGDGVRDEIDNCPTEPNPEQENVDGDSAGDACDTVDDSDGDGDGVRDEIDNCPTEPNPEQENADGDALGDVCDTLDGRDGDRDGAVLDDNCPTIANPDQADIDGDGRGDACDTQDDRDGDGDGVRDEIDNCPTEPNRGQENADGDALGDACDTIDGRDGDRDGVVLNDNCPAIANPDQANLDGDTFGDLCDDDVDGDGFANLEDNCEFVANPAQGDADRDGIGTLCDDEEVVPGGGGTGGGATGGGDTGATGAGGADTGTETDGGTLDGNGTGGATGNGTGGGTGGGTGNGTGGGTGNGTGGATGNGTGGATGNGTGGGTGDDPEDVPVT